MAMTDPIADILTRIRNGLAARRRWVDVPASVLKKRLLYVLKEERFIKDFLVITDGKKQTLRVFLLYGDSGAPMIQNLERVSTPGRRVYANVGHIPKVINGLGIAILTTSRGVVSDKVARRMNVGGEILCKVW